MMGDKSEYYGHYSTNSDGVQDSAIYCRVRSGSLTGASRSAIQGRRQTTWGQARWHKYCSIQGELPDGVFCERAVTRFYWRQHGRYTLLTYPDGHVDCVIRCRGAGGYATQVVGARLDLVKPFIDAQDVCRKNIDRLKFRM